MAQSVLDTAGPQAAGIAALWWLMFWVCLGVFALVIAALLIALLRARVRGSAAIPDPMSIGSAASERRIAWTVATCVAATAVVLFVFLVASVVTGHRLALLASDNALTIRLTGYRWWWKVQYLDPAPARAVITANEIHIPVGRPVLLKLHSVDVIHRLWVPNLAGTKALIPGPQTELWIQADGLDAGGA